MWQVIDESIWKQEIAALELSVFFQPDFINSISKAYHLNISYFKYQIKGKTLALLTVFSKGNNMHLPPASTYSAYYIKEGLNENDYFNLNHSLIVALKAKFSKVLLRLDPDKKDIRPFILNKFQIEVKYTHIKSNEGDYHSSVYKNLRKKDAQDYTFMVETLNEQSIKLNIDFLKEIGVSRGERENYNKLLRSTNYYKAFNVYRGEELICSNIVLIDSYSNKAYTILLNNVKKEEKYAHTFLYSSLISWCFQNNMLKIDLCGANMKSISIFKSYFNTELKVYFNLSYLSPRQNLVNTLKKILAVFGR